MDVKGLSSPKFSKLKMEEDGYQRKISENVY